MDLVTFLELARAYARLGDAIGDQLYAVASGERIEDQNYNALKACRLLLRALSKRDVDGADQLLDDINQAAE